MLNRLKARGFTLIELLVVIAIIAILAAILFPVFARAREAARKSSCQSNLNQLGKGFLMYVQDYDEMFPQVWSGNPNIANNLNWGPAIHPYIKNQQVYRCPSDRLSASLVACSYNANNWLDRRSDAAILAHADAIILMDGYTSEGGNYSVNNAATGNGLNADYTMWSTTGRATRQDKGLPRHSETNNMVFADGHVKSTKGLKPCTSDPCAPDVVGALQGAVPYNVHVYQGTANAWDPRRQ